MIAIERLINSIYLVMVDTGVKRKPIASNTDILSSTFPSKSIKQVNNKACLTTKTQRMQYKGY
jgi:hypothetical protein